MKETIWIIIWQLWWGWAERVATTVWTKLYEKWYQVFYITRYDVKNKYQFKWEEVCFWDEHSTNKIINFFRLFSRAYQIKKIASRHKIDTTVSFQEEFNFPNIISKILFFNKSKTIVSIRESTNTLSLPNRILIKLLYKYAKYVVPNSHEEAENLGKRYWLNKNVKVVYNPLNLKDIKELSKEKIQENIDFSKFTFITVWRLVYQKNQEFIIKNFIKFNEQHPTSQLLILWEGNLENYLKNISNGNKNIHFLWNKKNVYSYLSKSDCFLFSSNYEWFPNAVMEAMACWLPIISTKFETWISELLKYWEYWMLIDKNDDNQYIKAMKNIYNQKSTRIELSKKSFKTATDFDLEKVIYDRESLLG